MFNYIIKSSKFEKVEKMKRIPTQTNILFVGFFSKKYSAGRMTNFCFFCGAIVIAVEVLTHRSIKKYFIFFCY